MVTGDGRGVRSTEETNVSNGILLRKRGGALPEWLRVPGKPEERLGSGHVQVSVKLEPRS